MIRSAIFIISILLNHLYFYKFNLNILFIKFIMFLPTPNLLPIKFAMNNNILVIIIKNNIITIIFSILLIENIILLSPLIFYIY